MLRRAWPVYALLLVVRILIAFTSTSFIHPDEHFQNPEVAADLVFKYDSAGDGLLETWEWTGDSPCRSIVPVFGSTGLAFAVLRAVVGTDPSTRALFVAQRGIMLLFSFVLDYLVWTTSRSDLSLLLFASSPLTFTFLLRAFSNTLEGFLLALSFSSLNRILVKASPRSLAFLGTVLSLGFFTRITFIAFATPLVVATVVRLSARTFWDQGLMSGLVRLLALGLPAALSFVATSLLLSLLDTLYFTSTFPLSPTRFILTPLNFLRYNLSSENLASHGLHPRYLHVLVNWPMLFGAGLAMVWSAVLSRGGVEKQDGKKAESRRRVYLASFVIPTLLLSIQPHQEPRFLIPLVIPLVLLAPYASFFRSGRRGAVFARRAFWTLWILHTILFTALFGYLHQGGLLPALFELNAEFRRPSSELSGANQIDLVFWKTFMPPRHLLLPAGSTAFPAIRIVDLAGAPVPSLLSTLSSAMHPPLATHERSNDLRHPVLLVAPAYIVDKVALACNSSSAPTENGRITAADAPVCLEEYLGGASFGVHVDMDRLDEYFSASSRRRVGVGVWKVQRR
ncbi:hypothetical protein JCM8547_006806 [Rhodosporidiobolus lusitaniae]